MSREKRNSKVFIYEFGPLTKDWALPYQESVIRALAGDAIKSSDKIIIRRKKTKKIKNNFMKNTLKLIALFLLISFNYSRAGHVIDNANILGEKALQLQAEISPLPVFIESHESLNDIKGFADERVKSLTSKGFIIVITTHPRKWRISMTPEGITSGEETRVIGDKMMSYFKNGDYYTGLLFASGELNKLVQKLDGLPLVESKAESKAQENKSNAIISIGLITLAAMIIVVFFWAIYNWVNRNSEGKSFTTPKEELLRRKGIYEGINQTNTNLYPPKSSRLQSNPREQRPRFESSPRFYQESSSQPDLITPVILYSALSSHASSNSSSHSSSSHSNDDDSHRSSPSTNYSSYDSSGSSYSNSSSSSSDSSGSSGGDW